MQLNLAVMMINELKFMNIFLCCRVSTRGSTTRRAMKTWKEKY